MAKDPQLRALRANLRLAKAGLAAAKQAGNATQARKEIERIATIKGQIEGYKVASKSFDETGAPKYLQKRMAKQEALRKAHAASVPAGPDPELDKIRDLLRYVNDPRSGYSRDALEQLQKMVSPDELADILNGRLTPERLVRKAGPNPSKRQGEESLARWIRDLQNPATSPSDRSAILDRLVKIAGDDRKAQDALAEIALKIR